MKHILILIAAIVTAFSTASAACSNGAKDTKGLATVVFSANLHCENCKTRVENALNRTDGVWARVDLKSGTADVKMKKRLPEIELRRIISAIGYGIEKVDFTD